MVVHVYPGKLPEFFGYNRDPDPMLCKTFPLSCFPPEVLANTHESAFVMWTNGRRTRETRRESMEERRRGTAKEEKNSSRLQKKDREAKRKNICKR